MQDQVTQAASLLGSLGGKAKSKRKTEAARRNAKLPRKRKVKKVVDDSQAVC